MIYSQTDLEYSFYEVSEILKYIPIEYSNKLPKKLKTFINENKINNGFIYNNEKTLDNQKMLDCTKSIISVLYRTYWCSAEQRKRLKEEDNEFLKTKYDVNNIFIKNRHEENIKKNITENEVSMVEYKESIFNRVINKIKNIFNLFSQ